MSSDSANITMISTCPPKVMRSGNRKKQAIATAQGSSSTQRKRCRCERYSAARSRAWPRAAAGLLLSAIEPRRLDQEDEHRDRVDEEAAGIREQIFAGGVEDAEHQRREQRSLEAAEPADGDDEQEQ